MRDKTAAYWPILPRGVWYFVTALLVLIRLRWWIGAAFAATLLGSPFAFGSMTSLPPASREESLCIALGTEAPCAYHEIARLKGLVTFFAADQDATFPVMTTVFTAKRQSHARVELFGSVGETAMLDRVRDPATNWDNLIPPSDTWPTLRALARVIDGVPVIVAAVMAKHSDQDHTGDTLASVAALRVRLAFMVLD